MYQTKDVYRMRIRDIEDTDLSVGLYRLNVKGKERFSVSVTDSDGFIIDNDFFNSYKPAFEQYLSGDEYYKDYGKVD